MQEGTEATTTNEMIMNDITLPEGIEKFRCNGHTLFIGIVEDQPGLFSATFQGYTAYGKTRMESAIACLEMWNSDEYPTYRPPFHDEGNTDAAGNVFSDAEGEL